MAIIYVDNVGGSDSTPYGSWGAAAADIQDAWALWTSGDVIWVEIDHSQTQGTTETLPADVMDGSDPCPIYSVDNSDDSYSPATSAQIATTGAGVGIDFADSVRLHGIYLQTEDGPFTFGGGSSIGNYLKDCTLHTTDTTGGREILGDFEAVNCTFTNPTSVSGAMVFATSAFWLRGCTLTGRWPNGITWGTPWFWATGCDMSGMTDLAGNNLYGANGATRIMELVDCVYPASAVLPNPTTGVQGFVKNYSSAIAGASTAKSYIMEHYFEQGTVDQDIVVYRDAGWVSNEGDTPLSHQMTPLAALTGPHMPFYGPDLYATVETTGSKTFTVYGGEDFASALTEDQAWIEVYYLGTTNSVEWSLAGGRNIFSSTALATNTEAWTGETFSRYIEFSETVTINKTGKYMVRVFLAAYSAGDSLWYCPKVEVT